MKLNLIIVFFFMFFVSGMFSQNQKLLTNDDLVDENSESLRIMRNEIFANYGYIFKSKDLNDYFLLKSWYNPLHKNVDHLLTEIDKKNIALILEKEKSFNKSMDYKEEIFVSTQDSIKIPSFSVTINLSPKADKKLKEINESIIVQAYFRGIPIDKTIEEYEMFDHFTFGSYSIELTDSNKAIFKSVWVPKKFFELLEDPNFEVLINVFTGRKSSSYNLITGEILQDLIFSIMDKNHILNYELL